VFSAGLNRDADADTGPAGNPFLGDGLVAYEEYRGFMVSGGHVRTHPGNKDLFVRSMLPQGVGDAMWMQIYICQVVSTEMDAQRVVNFNHTNIGSGGNILGHTDQKALVVVDSLWSLTGVVGMVTPILPVPPNYYSPNNTSTVEVFTETIKWVSPSHNDPPPSQQADPFDNDKIAQTLGHELGHALNLAHISVAHACPPPVWTVMVTNYFQQTTLLTDCAWNNIPHEYTAAEIAALRVR
jgi:hypothetical protein